MKVARNALVLRKHALECIRHINTVKDTYS